MKEMNSQKGVERKAKESGWPPGAGAELGILEIVSKIVEKKCFLFLSLENHDLVDVDICVVCDCSFR